MHENIKVVLECLAIAGAGAVIGLGVGKVVVWASKRFRDK